MFPEPEQGNTHINIKMSDRPSACISPAPTGRISVTLEFLDTYDTMPVKSKFFFLNLLRISVTLHEDICSLDAAYTWDINTTDFCVSKSKLSVLIELFTATYIPQ